MAKLGTTVATGGERHMIIVDTTKLSAADSQMLSDVKPLVEIAGAGDDTATTVILAETVISAGHHPGADPGRAEAVGKLIGLFHAQGAFAGEKRVK